MDCSNFYFFKRVSRQKLASNSCLTFHFNQQLPQLGMRHAESLLFLNASPACLWEFYKWSNVPILFLTALGSFTLGILSLLAFFCGICWRSCSFLSRPCASQAAQNKHSASRWVTVLISKNFRPTDYWCLLIGAAGHIQPTQSWCHPSLPRRKRRYKCAVE